MAAYMLTSLIFGPIRIATTSRVCLPRRRSEEDSSSHLPSPQRLRTIIPAARFYTAEPSDPIRSIGKSNLENDILGKPELEFGHFRSRRGYRPKISATNAAGSVCC